MATIETLKKEKWILAVLLATLAGLVYLSFRSPILISDGFGWIAHSERGHPHEFHYGATGHFLQMPLSRYLWLAFNALGFSITLKQIFLGLCFLGAVGSVAFFFLFLERFLSLFAKSDYTRFLAVIGSLLFAFSYAPWLYWNGELYSLSLLFSFIALWALLKEKFLLAGISWGLSVSCHSEFALLAIPISLMSYFLARERNEPFRDFFMRLSKFCIGSGLFTLVVILVGGYFLGKWNTPRTLFEWIYGDLEARNLWLKEAADPFRALKGLLTSVTVGGHYIGELLKGWRPQSLYHGFGLALSVFVLTIIVLGSIFAAFFQRAFLICCAWLVPLQVLLNWKFLPAMEEYHSASQPALVMLVVIGMVWLSHRVKYFKLTVLGFVMAFVTLNFFAGVYPMYRFGEKSIQVAKWFAQGSPKRVFSCDSQFYLDLSNTTYYRVRSLVREPDVTLEQIQVDARKWFQDGINKGFEMYSLSLGCDNAYWSTERELMGLKGVGPEITSFSFSFLEDHYRFSPTAFNSLPMSAVVQTNPLTWKTGVLYRVERK